MSPRRKSKQSGGKTPSKQHGRRTRGAKGRPKASMFAGRAQNFSRVAMDYADMPQGRGYRTTPLEAMGVPYRGDTRRHAPVSFHQAGVSPVVTTVPCPICTISFPADEIEAHAAECNLEDLTFQPLEDSEPEKVPIDRGKIAQEPDEDIRDYMENLAIQSSEDDEGISFQYHEDNVEYLPVGEEHEYDNEPAIAEEEAGVAGLPFEELASAIRKETAEIRALDEAHERIFLPGISDMYFHTDRAPGGAQHHQKGKGKFKEAAADVISLNDRLRNYVLSHDEQPVAFPPMHRFLRKQFHSLCELYGLHSESFGSGRHRYPQVSKTDDTILASQRAVSKLIMRLLKRSDQAHEWEPDQRLGMRRLKKERLKQQHSSDDEAGYGISEHFRQQGQVAGDAQPISDDNPGHRMLRMMGWDGASGLGATEQGRTDNIPVEIRRTRQGLGL